MGASWHLQQVEVFHPILNKMYVFPCNEWLETSKEKGVDGCKRTLLTGAAAADAGIVSARPVQPRARILHMQFRHFPCWLSTRLRAVTHASVPSIGVRRRATASW